MDEETKALIAAQNSQATALRPGESGAGRPYPKGMSGNPGGRNPEREALRRAMLSKGAGYLADVEEMARTARSEKVRLEARLWLAEKVIGKEPIELVDDKGNGLRVGLIILPAGGKEGDE